MKKTIWIFAAILLLIAPSCLVSIHPLYQEKDLIFLPELVGTWSDGESTWTFNRYDEQSNAYNMTITENNKENSFKVGLVKLGNYHYFDFYPEESSEELNLFFASHLLPVHTFCKVDLSNKDSFLLSPFKANFLKDLLKRNRIKIKHEYIPEKVLDVDIGTYVLTASTQELQKFMMNFGSEENAFEEGTLFHRKP
jgi:hypothetical protein